MLGLRCSGTAPVNGTLGGNYSLSSNARYCAGTFSLFPGMLAVVGTWTGCKHGLLHHFRVHVDNAQATLWARLCSWCLRGSQLWPCILMQCIRFLLVGTDQSTAGGGVGVLKYQHAAAARRVLVITAHSINIVYACASRCLPSYSEESCGAACSTSLAACHSFDLLNTFCTACRYAA